MYLLLLVYRWREELLKKRKKMESGEMPADQKDIKQKEQELYQRWERIVNTSFAPSDHTNYYSRRVIMLLMLTGYWIILYLWLMTLMETPTTTLSKESVDEKKPENDTKIVTHYGQWNVKRQEYFKGRDIYTETAENDR